MTARSSPDRSTAASSGSASMRASGRTGPTRSEEHTSELQSRQYLVCRLLLEKKKKEKIVFDLIKQIVHHDIIDQTFTCDVTLLHIITIDDTTMYVDYILILVTYAISCSAMY